VRVEALRKERQQMEVEGQAMAEQLTRGTNRQKYKLRNLVFMSLAMYDTWPCYAALEVELRLAQEAMAQLTETRDKAEEKAKKAIEELKREPGLVPCCLPFLFIGVKKLKIVIIATLCAEFSHQSQAQF
jgi:ABC-type arginine transport system ATPase subunit